MAERIAAAEIYVGVRDDEALANLRRIQAQFDRTMDDIDRTEAEATVGANLAPLKDDLANAKRMLRMLEKEEADLGLEISDEDKLRFKKDIAEAKRLIKSIDGDVARVEIEVHGEKEALASNERIRKATQERYDSEEKLLDDLEKVRARAARRNTKRVNDEARVRESLNRQRIRELNTDERLAYQRERELASIPKLEQRYVGLQRRLEALNRVRKERPRPTKDQVFDLDVKERGIIAEVERIRAEIQAIAGRDPIEIPVKAQWARNWGTTLRSDMLRHQGNWTGVSASVGQRIGQRMQTGWRDGLNRGLSRVALDATKSFGRTVVGGLAGGAQRFAHAAGGLADSTIRLGPFTTTIRKAVLALSLFAPILLDVVGALGALVGSVGSATLGLGALATAVVGGGIPVLLGMGIVIKQVATEFTNVMKAQKAYDDAIRKGNTELAATKMKELRATMGNVSEETVKNIGLARKLNDRWKEATEPARAAAFTTIGHAIRMASDLMPEFATRTNTAMQTAGRSIDNWMARLSSAGGRSALFEMMDNFNASLGPLLDGLGDVAAYLGRVGQIASRFLPTMSNNFANWAHNLNSVDTTTLTGKVNRTIDSLRALGRFLMATGRLIKAFFGAGVDSGNNLLDVMTNAMTGWTNWMNTVEGQDSLHSFFSESADGARTLWNTLQPVITSFVRWAAQVAPFARSFFDGAAAVGNLVSELLRLTGLSGSFAALATTLGALWAWGKIRATATAIAAFVTALTGQAAAETAAATAAGRNTVAQNAQAVATARSAEAAVAATVAYERLAFAGAASSVAGGGAAIGGAAATAATASRWSKVGTAVNGASMAMLGMRAATAGYIGVAALTGYAIYKLATATSDFEDHINDANAAIKQFHDSADQSISVANGLNTALLTGALGIDSSTLSIRQLREQMKGLNKNSIEYKQLLNQIQSMKQQRAAAAQQELKDLFAEKAARDGAVLSAQEELRSSKDKTKALKDEADAWTDWMTAQNPEAAAEAQKNYTDALAEQQEVRKHLNLVQDQAALGYYNEQRALAKLPPLAAAAGHAFRMLEKASNKQLATKVSLKYDDPGKAQRVGAAAARALKQGAGKGTVMKIIADSRSADQAIARLNRARITPKELKIIAKGGDAALRELQRIVGVRLAPKVQHILGEDTDAKSKIRALIRLGIPPKTAKMLGDNRDALAKAREANFTRLNTLFQTIQRTISNPPGLWARLAPIYQTVIRQAHGAAGGMFAAGGAASMPNERQQMRAARTAELSGSAQRAVSQKVNRPRYLVGEEATPEIVVSTNPAYRERNQKFAAMAARMVGLEVTDPFGGAIAAAGGFGDFGPGAGFHPEAVIKRRKKFHPTKKRKKAYRSRRSWATYVANLEKQQGYWEREVGIRDSKVREPEDMVIRAPENDKTVKDPTTGDAVKVEAYKANPKIESEYKPDLQNVINAMNTLMSIVRELVRAIPKAIAAARQESGMRHDRIGNLNEHIKREKNKLQNADADDKQKHQNRIDKLTAERDRHKGIRDTLEQDVKELKAAQVEAGFDWREYAVTRASYRKERDEVYGKAETQAKEDTLANVPTAGSGGGGGGGGGAGEGGITYGQQAALVDSEKASILQQFGSNFSATGGTPGGLGAAGVGAAQGMQGSLAALGSVGGTTADLTAAVGGTATRSALQSSGDASTAVMGGTGGTTTVQGGTTSVEGDKTIIVQASFAEVPPDPHTFVKGVEFEVASVI